MCVYFFRRQDLVRKLTRGADGVCIRDPARDMVDHLPVSLAVAQDLVPQQRV
jgi:hypothetical protein